MSAAVEAPVWTPSAATSRRAERPAYRLRLHDSIAQIAAAEWDSVLAPGDALHSHAFLLALEESKVEQAEFTYVTVFHEGRLIATAALSVFDVALDLMLTGAARRWIDFGRKLWPRLLRLRVLFCGVPASLGQRNVVIADPAHAAAVAGLLADTMESLARRRGISLLCVKELSDADARALASLQDRGYLRAESLPYMSLPLRWDSFADFLAALRHPYRRKIKQALARLSGSPPRLLDGAHGFEQGPGIYLLAAERLPPQRFHALYQQVMARAETQLERLNERFFADMAARMGSQLRWLVDVRGGEIRAAALVLREGTVLKFLLFGQLATNRDDDEHYFNMLCALLELALSEGCSRLDLGQTTYWYKQQIGAEPQARHVFLRARSRLLQALLRRFRDQLFPPTPLVQAHVFKQSAAGEVPR